MSECALIVPENFIQATRDSGYKSLGSALAELVDNSFEAKASNVTVSIEKVSEGGLADVRVSVADDGIGMDRQTLQHALQFGWSSRFNQRDSHGRYGMGLPNASLSHARRVEVSSSLGDQVAAGTYLDVDEVAAHRSLSIPQPQAFAWDAFSRSTPFQRGTVVTWQKCDRLVERKLGPLTRKLRAELGRLFRYQLWAKKHILVNGESVLPFDPLFWREGSNLSGATPYGPELLYPVALAGSGKNRVSNIRVRFTELPVEEWHSLSNEEKNSQGIAKNAGISIVRSGREIDRGWFFMGHKRKENYDDWWRCEVLFEPDLDEFFGVTHTKQEIHPSEPLLAILVPDMERIARELNARARRDFLNVKAELHRRDSEKSAEKFDGLLEPPADLIGSGRVRPKGETIGRGRVKGLEYRVRFRRLESECLFHPELEGGRLTVVVNEAHPLARQVWPRELDRAREGGTSQRAMEILLLALGRAEFALATHGRDKRCIELFRRTWSSILGTFLS